jgi:prevent-host-death family protein
VQYKLVDKLVCLSDNRYVKTVGAFEAKTRLNELLRRASKGETIQITRRGVPMARLTPPDTDQKRDPRALVEAIRRLRKGTTLGAVTIRELIEEGRRY